jgi:HD-GYP domain-containing protein (c-di-GMP phosphodiesterase class II)
VKTTAKLHTTKELHLSTSELKQVYDDTLVALATALELRDGQPRGHSLRVTEMALALAKALGVSSSKMVHIRRGGLLHDAGNLRVPEEILHKEGELTVEEWITIHMHPFYAYEMLIAIPVLVPALDIPYCHHEKWDGNGYPRGLKGVDIPLAARIFAVADVWDALTSDRPQRKAWSRQAALSYMREQSGKHFDPQVVTAFLELIQV